MNLVFPNIDDLMPHATAFAKLMLAHAAFEAEVRNLQGVVAGDESFGEQPRNQWDARKRPKLMAELIKAKLGDIEEARPIVDVLTRAKKPTEVRNLLAHGRWWRFQNDTKVLTVRSAIIRKGKPAHSDWTVADIDGVAETFDDLEAELFKLRCELERNWVEATVG
jgi:hypothetical protein